MSAPSDAARSGAASGFPIASDAKAALTLLAADAGGRAAGRLPDWSGWARDCAERKRTMLRQTHFDNVPIRLQRVCEDMNGKVVEGLGCKALRVLDPADLRPALEKAVLPMAVYQVPVVVDVILERVTNVSMGTELNNVTEFEQLATLPEHAPTAIANLA